MNSTIRAIGAWLQVALLAMLTIAAVTGVPHFEQPELLDPIIAIVLWSKR